MSSKWSEVVKYAGIGLAVVGVGAGVYYLFSQTADDAATADDTPKKDEPVEAATKPDATAASTGGGSGGAGSAGAATGAAPSDAAVSKELLVNILQRIISGSQQLLVALAQDPQSQSLPPSEISKKFMKQVENFEKEIYSRAGVSGAAVEAATDKYATDPEVKALAVQLHRIFTMVTGQEDLPEVPEWLDVDTFVEALRAYGQTVNKCFDSALETALSTGLTGQALLVKVNAEVTSEAVRTQQEAVLREHKLDEKLLQSCIGKYQTDKRVGEVLQAMQVYQQEKLSQVLSGPAASS